MEIQYQTLQQLLVCTQGKLIERRDALRRDSKRPWPSEGRVPWVARSNEAFSSKDKKLRGLLQTSQSRQDCLPFWMGTHSYVSPGLCPDKPSEGCLM